MKKIIFSMISFLFLVSLAFAAPQTKCPVRGDAIDKKVFTDYNGYRIYFCCSSCIHDFKKNPDKFIKKMKEEKIDLEKSPAPEAKKEAPAATTDKAKK